MMDKPQREVQRELLREEKEVKKKLRANYRAALADVKKWLQGLTEDQDIVPENIRHDKYQRMLEAQLTELLKELGDRNVSVTDGYLHEAYKEAYLGCLYRMHHDGVDLVVQIDPNRVERAIRRKTKDLQFSERIYQNVDQLKEETKSEIARGFSTGQDYLWMAARISQRVGIAYSNACRIARTEGHRIANESDMDAMRDAVAAGADVVKEWNSTLDDVTRSTHRELDGQVRELDEPFEIPSTGSRAMYPGGFGIAKEDIHCRCCMNQRARWALDSERYKYSRENGTIINLKSNIYSTWKKRYNQAYELLYLNAPGKNNRDTIRDKIEFMKCRAMLSDKAYQVIENYKVEFGMDYSATNTYRKLIQLEPGASEKSIFHEIGHALEAVLFSDTEVEALKEKYVEGLGLENICQVKGYNSAGTHSKNIYIVRGSKLLNGYQGRIYIDEPYQGVRSDGTIDVSLMHEFLSEPISLYYTNPDELMRRDEELYEFIREHLE
ncbi:MAG: hypothetical protein HDR21_12155 [Lachnospiraceae bacterium]|nr:hypothetical protein [Lachnospiraceae bacterium]